MGNQIGILDHSEFNKINAGENNSKKKIAVATGVTAAALVGAGLAGYFIYREVSKKNPEYLDRCSQVSESVCSASYVTALDSMEEEDEFYECIDEEEADVLELFDKVDRLMEGDDDDRLEAFNLLSENEELRENANFLWRFAKAHRLRAPLESEEKRMDLFDEGLKYATDALELDNANVEVHKWVAILNGALAELVPIQQKTKCTSLFLKHIYIAQKMKPKDSLVHHVLGRFKYEVAGLPLYKKSFARSVIEDFPNVNYFDAMENFKKAEVNSPAWKENKLWLAKCYLQLQDNWRALNLLKSAKQIKPKTREDRDCDKEIDKLLREFNVTT